MNDHVENQGSSAAYFSSPEEAVPVISDLLRDKDFKTLTRYYDLSASKVQRAALESGRFFIRETHPEMAHPAGFWRYKHPFSPGFQYSATTPTTRENISLIRVEIRIDQGEGIPSQVGIDSFYMIHSDKGWQILPDPVTGTESPEPPSTTPEPLPDPPWKK